jgi:hypothetical protein
MKDPEVHRGATGKFLGAVLPWGAPDQQQQHHVELGRHESFQALAVLLAHENNCPSFLSRGSVHTSRKGEISWSLAESMGFTCYLYQKGPFLSNPSSWACHYQNQGQHVTCESQQSGLSAAFQNTTAQNPGARAMFTYISAHCSLFSPVTGIY